MYCFKSNQIMHGYFSIILACLFGGYKWQADTTKSTWDTDPYNTRLPALITSTHLTSIEHFFWPYYTLPDEIHLQDAAITFRVNCIDASLNG